MAVEKYSLGFILFTYLKLTTKNVYWSRFEYEDTYKKWTVDEEIEDKDKVFYHDNSDDCPSINDDFKDSMSAFKREWKKFLNRFGLKNFNRLFSDTRAKKFTLKEAKIIICLYDKSISDPVWTDYLNNILPLRKKKKGNSETGDAFQYKSLTAGIKKYYEKSYPTENNIPDLSEQIDYLLSAQPNNKDNNKQDEDQESNQKSYSEIEDSIYEEIQIASRLLRCLLKNHMDVLDTPVDITEQTIDATSIVPKSRGRWSIYNGK